MGFPTRYGPAGYALDAPARNEYALVRLILENAREFFGQRDEVCQGTRWLLPGTVVGKQRAHTGFHGVGDEHVAYGRPDIMESFGILEAELDDAKRRDLSRLFVPSAMLWLKTWVCRRAAAAYTAYAGRPFDFWKYTIIQLTYYRPGDYTPRAGETPLEQREYLVDPHEDGHFLTWLVADAPGLVGRPGNIGNWEGLDYGPGAAVVFPSLPYTLWAGGAPPPYYHAVRRATALGPVADRVSLGIFLTPDLGNEIPALMWSSMNEGLMLGQIMNESQLRFGAPRYTDKAPTNEKTTKYIKEIYG